MKSKIFIIIILAFVSNKMISQTNDIINLKGKWFFGVEIGRNYIASYNFNEPTKSFQGGLLAEYYFSKKWSVTGRLKYFKIGQSNGVSYVNSVPDLKNYQRFDGEVLSVPLNLKWEYKISKKFTGNLKFGIALNQETVSKYYYPNGRHTNFPTFFVDYNFGFGFSYYINDNSAVYIERELKGLGKDRDDTPTFITPNSTDNTFLNIGIKHNFKNKTK